MSQSNLAIDYDFVTEQIRASWNGWNPQQRSIWTMFHDLPVSQADFDDLPEAVQDALLIEYLDNAKRNLE